MAPKLQIARGFALPVDVAGEAIAILAKRGAGKTNTATVLVEELYRAKVQTVTLDPVGAWWGLRSSADGKTEGLPIPILGGQHGDVPLEHTAGAVIADAVVDHDASMLLDLSDFSSKKQMRQFVVDFAERLFRRKARQSSLLHVVLEEADTFAPQNAGRADDGRMQAAIEQIVRRGRSRGLGITMVTQRSAVLSKDVLTQADVLIVMRTTGPQDVRAIKDWVASRGDEHAQEILDSLPSLGNGEAWVWNPERGLAERIQVRLRHTFDSSRTPRAGERRRQPKQLAEINIEALGEQIAATAERAKANDPAELRRQIQALERRNAELANWPAAEPQVSVETIEIPVVSPEDVATLTAAADALVDSQQAIEAIVGRVAAPAAAIVAALERIGKTELPAKTPQQPPAPERRPPGLADGRPVPRAAKTTPRSQPETRSPSLDGTGELTGPEARVLDAIAWFNGIGMPQPTKPMVGFIAGYRVGKRVGGTFGNILGRLHTNGFVTYPSPGQVALTEQGAAIARDPGIPQTDEGLQAAVLDRLEGPERRVLNVLIETHPNAISKQELGSLAGYQVGDRVGGTFGNILGRLRSLGLIDYPQPGEAVALDVLFPSRAYA